MGWKFYRFYMNDNLPEDREIGIIASAFEREKLYRFFADGREHLSPFPL